MAEKELGSGGSSAAEDVAVAEPEAPTAEPGAETMPPTSTTRGASPEHTEAITVPPTSAVVERGPDRSLLADGEIERVVGLADPVLRNLLITQSYHELSGALAQVIGQRDVNWSTFATWASKTAGRSIRGEEVPKFFLDVLGLEERLEEHLPSWLHGLLQRLGLLGRIQHAALATLREVSDEVAKGNLKVFEELGPVFRRFIRAMESGVSEEALAQFVETLRPGPVEKGGQDLLRAAFADYTAAARATGAEERGERMLLGNCRIGLHEQTRLQPNIQGAIDAPIDQIFGRYLRAGLPRFVRGPLAMLLGFLVRHFIGEVTELWQEVATRHAMRLALPNGKEISLGADVPILPSGVPPALQQLELPELRELFERFRGPNSGDAGSAANNWANLDDRMGFIVELFRVRQQELDLFGPPFPPDREQHILAGLIPAEELGEVPAGDLVA